ncbi:MAG: hypothetical protein IT457_05320 [Planctomycetes bacterium]|nr:hypothetical protein [Planctomycetota bacterium]
MADLSVCTMIHRSLLAFSSATLVALLATPAREVQVRVTEPVVSSAAEDTKLAKYMEEINKGFRKLRADLKDPQKNEGSLALVRSLGELCGKSRLEKPEMTKDIKEEERAQFLVDFQVAMLDMHGKLLELERALVEGNNELAVTLRDEINGQKSPAHKKFKSGDEGEGGGGGGERRR